MKKKLKALATGFEENFLYRPKAQKSSKMAGIEGNNWYQSEHSIFKPVHFMTFSVTVW